MYSSAEHGRRLRQMHKLEPAVMVRDTLRALVDGGVHDHFGGGFFEASMDAQWQVPDCEKTAATNAQLASALTEAWARYGEPAFADAARGALAYLRRRLLSPGGAAFAGEGVGELAAPVGDAAAGSGGGEVNLRRYAWSAGEVRGALLAAGFSGEFASAFCARYSITEGGNCADSEGSSPTRDLKGARWRAAAHQPEP